MVSVRPGNAYSALGNCILDPNVIALLNNFYPSSVTCDTNPTTMSEELFKAKG
jgi:hypothetical protein